jgi:hypothetical protein
MRFFVFIDLLGTIVSTSSFHPRFLTLVFVDLASYGCPRESQVHRICHISHYFVPTVGLSRCRCYWQSGSAADFHHHVGYHLWFTGKSCCIAQNSTYRIFQPLIFIIKREFMLVGWMDGRLPPLVSGSCAASQWVFTFVVDIRCTVSSFPSTRFGACTVSLGKWKYAHCHQ